IGSAQYSHMKDNPFTAGERYEMIYSSLREKGLERQAHIIPIIDVNRYSLWVSHVRSLVPPFSVVFTNNPLTERLFSESGYEVRKTKIYRRREYSGTHVRELMINGGGWRKLIPRGAAETIDSFGGVERVRELFRLSEKNEASGH
ncbi:MAG: nicotinamide-nucleotide adenylyltransferase, partial [Thermoplasmata archaeon]|nr:nicotinamide-nucleotide adenylyltransferase [Candidatus Sysuiplasma superficiale]